MKFKIKNEKGSIALYTLTSMMFFVIILVGLYVNSSYKMQKQQKELKKIQKSYDISNEMADALYDNYVSSIEIQYIVSYDANNGTGSISSTYVGKGDSYQIESNNNQITREGYTFNGWNTETDGTGTTYADGSTILAVNEDITLYALWSYEILYGSNIQNSYSIINSISNGQPTAINSSVGGTWRGNYSGTHVVENTIRSTGNRINPVTSATYLRKSVTAGTNTINFTEMPTNKWVDLYWTWGCSSGYQQIGNIKILFNNGQSITIQQAVNNGYIEPLVLYQSWDSARDNSPYVLDNPEQLISGGSQAKAYSEFRVCFKTKNVSPLKGVSFDTGGDWNVSYEYDGFEAFTSTSAEFSL